ncbi:hypothetical protein ABZU75_23395 [Streptosporangium sp. NPDC005286]|uniref:hypothetical protein n=1 Tax=Streptosporangium sp. NPDC005286 TaxID=3154463 RepID=UPI0033B9AB23
MTATARLGKRLALAALAGLILLGAGFAGANAADVDVLAGSGLPIRITLTNTAETPDAARS